MAENTLYYGDNLDVLRQHVKAESVDLVYLDPPFNSNADYNVLFGEQDGTRAEAQIKAFADTWHWDQTAARAFNEIVEEGPSGVSQTMVAFRTLVAESDVLAYLAMMAPRLVELHRVLKPTGSIYLHCDPTASHYLKLLMDGIFGPVSFKSEIIWKRTGAHNSAKKYGPVHDTIFFYSKSKLYKWNPQFTPLPDKTSEEWFNNIDAKTGERFNRDPLTAAGTRNGESGMPWRGVDVTGRGRHWAIPLLARGLVGKLGTIESLEALDAIGRIHWPAKKTGMPMFVKYLKESKGVPAQDVITDIAPLKNNSPERLGYPTQKPLELLQRIIKASSDVGDVVLDPFCGCGTAIDAANRLNRKWIGIDITHLAITLIKSRLLDAHGPEILKTYKVIGEPTTLHDAQALAQEKDRYQFQYWALGLVGARPLQVDQKKGADKGIDGRLYFHDDAETGKTKQVIFSVKSGHLKADDIRALGHVVDREKADIGVLIAMEEPTSKMRTDATSVGFYKSPWGTTHPRLQILTVAELLTGKKVDMPPTLDMRTFKKAPKAKKAATHTDQLLPFDQDEESEG